MAICNQLCLVARLTILKLLIIKATSQLARGESQAHHRSNKSAVCYESLSVVAAITKFSCLGNPRYNLIGCNQLHSILFSCIQEGCLAVCFKQCGTATFHKVYMYTSIRGLSDLATVQLPYCRVTAPQNIDGAAWQRTHSNRRQRRSTRCI